MTAPDDPVQLTRHIETRYHALHRTQMETLITLARRVETVHTDAPAGLADALGKLTGDLTQHMAREELILFPAIRRGGTPSLAQPIAVMRGDHDGHQAAIEDILALTHDLWLPDGACATWTRLYDGLATFLADLAEHTRLENEVLFPMFEPAPPSLHKGCACHGG